MEIVWGRGVQGLEGPPGITYKMSVGLRSHQGFTLPFAPVKLHIIGSNLYLGKPSSYYVINMSVESLGSSYVPDPNDPYNQPGSWSINTIFAGPPPVSGTLPKRVFQLSQLPVTFYFQNVGGLPIRLNFGSDDSRSNVTYLSFGSGPNAAPSSYLVEPLGILVIEAIFTSNNAIRIYNSFLDTLNPNRFYRILNRAVERGYFSRLIKVKGALANSNILTIDTDYTFNVLKASHTFSQTEMKVTAPITLTLDGTGVSSIAEVLLVIRPAFPIELVLVNLIGAKNYKGQPVPSTLPASNQFVVITGTRVVIYDQGSVSISYNSVPNAQSTVVASYSWQYNNEPGTPVSIISTTDVTVDNLGTVTFPQSGITYNVLVVGTIEGSGNSQSSISLKLDGNGINFSNGQTQTVNVIPLNQPATLGYSWNIVTTTDKATLYLPINEGNYNNIGITVTISQIQD
jgi:hypothetical protein